MFFKRKQKKLDQRQLALNWWLLNQGLRNEAGSGRSF